MIICVGKVLFLCVVGWMGKIIISII